MAKEQRHTPKKETETQQGITYKSGDGTCWKCSGKKKIQAPTYPGFEGKPTFEIPCDVCQ